jgi:predicted  nucleic acid-binding Zn-ribbon protein
VDIKQQLKILLDLQDRDLQIMKLNEQLKEKPRKLEEMHKDLAVLEEVVTRERTELDQEEKWRAEKDEEQRFIEAQVARLRGQLAGTRGHKEAVALQRQLDSSRKQNSDLEEEVLKTMAALEARRAAVKDHEGSLEALRAQLLDGEQTIRTEIAQLEAAVARIMGEREGMTKGLDEGVKKRYTILAPRRHPSVVEAKDGRCTGCNVALPPQLYNTLYHANSLESCPICQRLIYLKSAVFAEPKV